MNDLNGEPVNNGYHANGDHVNAEAVNDQNDLTKNTVDLFYDFLPTEQQVSLDDLYEKFSIGYYHSLDSLEADLIKLVATTKATRCKNDLACKYMDHFQNGAVACLKKKQEEFLKKWRTFYEGKFVTNQSSSRMENWYKSAGPRRHYNYITDYKVVTSLSASERAVQKKEQPAQGDE